MSNTENPRTHQYHEHIPQSVGSLTERTISVITPSSNHDIVLSVSTEKTRKRFENLRKNFSQAEKVVVVCGSFGLGDAIMEIRYVLQMALQNPDKKVVCQAPPILVPLLDSWKSHLPNISFVSAVDEQDIYSESTFFWFPEIKGTFDANRDRDWASNQGREMYQYLQTLYQQEKVMDYFSLSSYAHDEDSLQGLYQATETDRIDINTSDRDYALMMAVLGTPVSRQDIQENSILPLEITEVVDITQDLDIVLMPDAKEQPLLEHGTVSRSVKSLPLVTWSYIFENLSTNQSIGIVLGVSNREYCEQIISLAKHHGHHVEVIAGNLSQLVKQLLRAITIFGMDSGTTHLAKDVSRLNRKADRECQVRQVFNSEAAIFEQYAMTDSPVLEYISVEGKTDFSDLTRQEAIAIAAYIESGNL